MSHTVSKRTPSGRCIVAQRIDFQDLEESEIREELKQLNVLLAEAITKNEEVLELGFTLGLSSGKKAS